MEKKADIVEKYLDPDYCPGRYILERLSDKWTMLVILMLKENEVRRFSELQKSIGEISHKMLATTLKKLEASGLVERKVYPQVPPKVEYRLSNLGRSLFPLIKQLVEWSHENKAEIEANRPKV
ncbi:helix-turn-helix domain-containing protein [Limibacter armeniacum]|uniref:winged helix-turn-helix transcriptional regulator n=1 Tax=Limibacter armeniacum TaxID=466084 RepID=UPI002FE5B4A3